MSKPKVAFFDFACCEGCQLQVANFGEALLDILGAVDVVEFREVMSETWDQSYDVSIIEGSITTTHAVEKIKKIRERSRILIAYGSCATLGGVNGMKNNYPLEEIRERVYGDKAHFFETIPTMAVHEVVDVDYFIYGCPIYPPELVAVLKSVLGGTTYAVPDKSVCVECKLNENVCLYEKGVTCLGPVTRAGCNSWCTNNGNICYGCRGLVTNPNKDSMTSVLKKYDIPLEHVMNKMNMYNAIRLRQDETKVGEK